MSKLLLPDLAVARGTASLPERQVDALNDPSCLYKELVAKHGKTALNRFRYIGAVTAKVSIDPLEHVQVDSWDALAQTTHEIISEQIRELVITTPSELRFTEKEDVDLRLEKVSRSGAAQIAAFLEVVPRVLFRSDFEDASTAIAERAQRSKGLIVRWSKLSDESDMKLTYGAAFPKPDVESDHPYGGLWFHTKWFEEKPNGAVGFKAHKLPHMRNENDEGLAFHKTDETILGCPAVKLVPIMYDAMVKSAAANELFGRTYNTERQNHGYTDTP